MGSFGAPAVLRRTVLQAGEDASFLLDGAPMTSAANTVSGVVPGVTFTLLREDPGNPVTVTVSRDEAAVEGKLKAGLPADRPVRVRFLPRAGALADPDLIRAKVNLIPETVDPIRVIEREGLDEQADAGTHVRSTAEVGPVTETPGGQATVREQKLKIGDFWTTFQLRYSQTREADGSVHRTQWHFGSGLGMTVMSTPSARTPIGTLM